MQQIVGDLDRQDYRLTPRRDPLRGFVILAISVGTT
jgi:hypothetical protein